VIVMPKYGMTMKQGKVLRWLVEEGSQVEAGMPIAEIETEKITNELESPASGTLLKIIVPVGAKAAVGAAIAVMGEPDEDIDAVLAEVTASAAGDNGEQPPPDAATAARAREIGKAGSAPEPGRRLLVSPAAKKLAAELRVDLAGVSGTGAGGRITREDVAAAAAGQPAGEIPQSSADPRGPAKERPYSGVRRIIGERMDESLRTTVPVSYHGLADVQELRQLLARVADQMRRQHTGIDDDVLMTAAIVKAVACALQKMPRFNSSLEGDLIKVWQRINIGVAVALPRGLIVPVIRDADGKPLNQIAVEIRDLAERARENQLSADEVAGGTFTVSTLGPYRSVDFFSPIINLPEAAILGVGRTRDTVVAVDGHPVVRATMGLSLTCDHRVLDGAPAAELLETVMDHLAEPLSLLV